MKKAVFFKKNNGKVQCTACQRKCIIPKNSPGYCRVRKNINGTLYSLSYNHALTLTADPIEKKPLYHFRPGTYSNSISTYGCNFSCQYCQNHHISQGFLEKDLEKVQETTPEQIVENTIERNLEGIAYTYNEPTVFIEYALDTMKLAKKQGLYNAWISNGYMSQEALEKISKHLDAANIDLKGNAEFYKKLCGNAELKKVKKSISYLNKKIHLELTCLIIPGYNDSEKELTQTSAFVASLGKNTPLHFSRFFPHYKMQNTPSTEIKTLQNAFQIAKKTGLNHVFLGNTASQQNTYCPKCNSLAIQRMHTIKTHLDSKGNCLNCGYKLGIKI